MLAGNFQGDKVNELIIFILASLLTILLAWGFKNLPKEKWQILGAVPRTKGKNGFWSGTNFTYYGLFNAVSVVFATAITIATMGAVDIPVSGVLLIAGCVFAVALPASGMVARFVEKKASAFSIGGASFVGVLVAPWAVLFARKAVGFDAPVIPAVASLAIAYAFGEGVGRLACVSFGCCYGKPLRECGNFLQRCFRRRHFVFTGKTKKIAYAHDLEGSAVIPIQAVTSVIYCASGLLGLYLFANGFFGSAFLEALIVTQVWRFASEFYRIDYRGGGKISAYQKMSLGAVLYGFVVAWVFHAPGVYPADLFQGLKQLWNPALILILQFLGVVVFLRMGKSSVTGATILFHVRKEKI